MSVLRQCWSYTSKVYGCTGADVPLVIAEANGSVPSSNGIFVTIVDTSAGTTDERFVLFASIATSIKVELRLSELSVL